MVSNKIIYFGSPAKGKFFSDICLKHSISEDFHIVDDEDSLTEILRTLKTIPLLFLCDTAKGDTQESLRIISMTHRLMGPLFKVLITESLIPEDVSLAINKEILQGVILQTWNTDIIEQSFLFLVKRSRLKLQSQNKMNELYDQMWKLNQIGIALSVEHDLDSLLEQILTEARLFTRADAGSLYIVGDNTLNFVRAQNDTLDAKVGKSSEQTFKSIPLPLSTKSIAGFVALTGRSLNIYDVYNVPENVPFTFDKSFDTKTGYRTKSMLVVPMQDDRDKTIGVLQLINPISENQQVITFKPEDEDLVKSLASQAAIALRNASLITEIKQLLTAILEFSSSVIDARSAYTAGHSRRIATLSLNIAKKINRLTQGQMAHIHFSKEDMDALQYAAYLHDIGKIGVPEHILDKRTKISAEQISLVKERFNCLLLEQEKNLWKNYRGKLTDSITQERNELVKQWKNEFQEHMEFIEKINIPGFLSDEDIERLKKIAEITYSPTGEKHINILDDDHIRNLSIRKGNLTDEERIEIEKHIEYTIKILQNIPFPEQLTSVPVIAAAHHEKLDGTGYPNKLKADQIDTPARILAVADFFDALTARDRPYKKPLSPEKSLAILRDEAKKNKLDPHIIEILADPDVYNDVLEDL